MKALSERLRQLAVQTGERRQSVRMSIKAADDLQELIVELEDLEKRNVYLEDLYKVHTSPDPSGGHRVDVQVYVDGRPVMAGTLAIARNESEADDVKAAVFDLQAKLDDFWKTFVEDLRANLSRRAYRKREQG